MRVSTHHLPGLVVTNHRFRCPLDPEDPSAGDIDVFAREVIAPGKHAQNLPWLVFFQGGPGFGAPRPVSATGWIKRAIREFRVVLLDQRGTGLSTPVTAHTLQKLGSPENMAAYLRHFRQDAIVRDAEHIRKTLTDGRPWTGLGQSYGGFCLTHYLSAVPEGLATALITGGLPPLDRSADDIYRATYPRVRRRNERYYERYPEDVDLVLEIARHLERHDVRLPSGTRLTIRKLQQLGLAFGMSDGFETVHYLLETAFLEGPEGPALSPTFLRGVEAQLPFDLQPIFAVLHEPIYAQGAATLWSAERIRAEFPEFEPDPARRRPLLFTGEMTYPWMLEEHAELRPMAEAARILAEDKTWPRLYDREKLLRNTVPVAAAIYHDDMYVERVFSEETAGTIRGARAWITNEFDHNGLRADGENILDRLLAMARGER